MSSLFEESPRQYGNYPDNIELSIIPRTVDIGGFEVHRALPYSSRQMVGPFIFWDQMGPGRFEAGKGVDVRPHPHIGLSTVTYLFEGSLDHKDSLGNDLRIIPGDVNLMTAGSGIVHSERTGQDIRKNSSMLAGIQSWMAQPIEYEEKEPGFSHFPGSSLPTFSENGLQGTVILGEFMGVVSPIPLQWETCYVDLELKCGMTIEFTAAQEERAIHLNSGSIDIGTGFYAAPQMVIFQPDCSVVVKAREDTRLLLLGGSAMDSKRYIWWNFVASSIEKIEQAAVHWKQGRFGLIPGDDREFIPLPDRPFPQR